MKLSISRAALSLALCTVLAGCATDGFMSGAVRYQCDNGLGVVVRTDGSAAVQTARGSDLLLRDAGGLTPQQVVYSNAQMRLTTGLGDDAAGAYIEGMVPNRAARCARVGGGRAPATPSAPLPGA